MTARPRTVLWNFHPLLLLLWLVETEDDDDDEGEGEEPQVVLNLSKKRDTIVFNKEI